MNDIILASIIYILLYLQIILQIFYVSYIVVKSVILFGGSQSWVGPLSTQDTTHDNHNALQSSGPDTQVSNRYWQ